MVEKAAPALPKDSTRQRIGISEFQREVSTGHVSSGGWAVVWRSESGPRRGGSASPGGWWVLCGRYPVSGRGCGGGGHEALTGR